MRRGGEDDLPVEARWARFLARTDFPCPGCGYNLRGLTGPGCPECGRRVEMESAMYCSEHDGSLRLFGSEVSLWVAVLLNLCMLSCTQWFLPALDCSRWTVRPPSAWYGLLILRGVWLGLTALGAVLWWMDLQGVRSESEGLHWWLERGGWLVVAMTVVHAVWVGGRVFFGP